MAPSTECARQKAPCQPRRELSAQREPDTRNLAAHSRLAAPICGHPIGAPSRPGAGKSSDLRPHRRRIPPHSLIRSCPRPAAVENAPSPSRTPRRPPAAFVMSSRTAFAPSSLLSPSLSRSPPRVRVAAKRAATMSATPCVSRRAFVLSALLGAAAVSLAPPRAAHAFGRKTSMTGDYKVDAAQVLTDMRAACDLGRGAPGMAEKVGKTREEMNDFVALYRRNDKVAGSTSFSTMYTAINTLSGHYASYGSSYPVPEKRKKRLSQQFSEIDRALSRGR